MIALDIETSGVDPERASILSLGALDTEDPTDQFYDECRAWDGAHISDEALAVNGFTREEATDPSKKTEAELIATFVAWALAEKPASGGANNGVPRSRNTTLVSQNSAFDKDFAQAACRRAKIEFPFAHRTLDTHSLVWLHMVERGIEPPVSHNHSGINLTAALAYCGLPPEQKPHNALTGAFAHAEILSRIAYNKKMLPEYLSYEIPWLQTEAEKTGK